MHWDLLAVEQRQDQEAVEPCDKNGFDKCRAQVQASPGGSGTLVVSHRQIQSRRDVVRVCGETVTMLAFEQSREQDEGNLVVVNRTISQLAP